MNPGLIGGFGGRANGGGKPDRITTYTSGTGTFTPLSADSWCRVTLVGAGGGGGRPFSGVQPGSGGAGGGQTIVQWLRTPAAIAYAVGAGGVGSAINGSDGASGGDTSLGWLVAGGGRFGTSAAGSGTGGGYDGSARIWIDGGTSGGYGGQGGNGGAAGSGGWAPGYPQGTVLNPQISAGGTGATGKGGGGGGGSSVYGRGGDGGAASTGTAAAGGNGAGYGAGGGGGGNGTTTGNGGNGSGGLIIIEEYTQ